MYIVGAAFQGQNQRIRIRICTFPVSFWHHIFVRPGLSVPNTGAVAVRHSRASPLCRGSTLRCPGSPLHIWTPSSLLCRVFNCSVQPLPEINSRKWDFSWRYGTGMCVLFWSCFFLKRKNPKLDIFGNVGQSKQGVPKSPSRLLLMAPSLCLIVLLLPTPHQPPIQTPAFQA